MAEKARMYFLEAIQELNIPGAAFALVRNGEIILTETVGVTGGRQKQEVTLETPFIIGSNSKALTAYGAMQLVQAGELKLSDPVQDYLPSFHLLNGEDISQMTVGQLLTHSSGFSARSGFKIADRGAVDLEAIQRNVDLLANEELAFLPGERYEYGAAGYAILGAIIEAITGLSFAEYMEENIFVPLNMTHTAASNEKAHQKGWESGYHSWLGMPVSSNVAYDNGGAPYGYITASISDMAHYVQALQVPGDVLSEEHTQLLFEPLVQTSPASSYGLGWRITPLEYGETKIWHSGSTADFRSEIFMLQDAGWGMVLLSNRNHPFEVEQLSSVSGGIQNILQGEEPAPVKAKLAIERWALVLICIVLLVLMIFYILSLSKKSSNMVRKPRWLVMSILYILLAILLLPSLLLIVGLPWHTLLIMAPDLVYLLIGISILLLINGGLTSTIALQYPRRSIL
ncbi:serine hydrolase domain-containing protein [Bacillus horti]|uniref:CubicO group peptidase (Beta-lactamase class C family) n=1 Tax=Caldalkalibacillus horti TaxID=77523 RepID=A0ABT9VU85_9BACI|nr:serine hydrolase domain-containing protein [Bacillus horti]MDQ0164551.1 CubicO group peptidase (beta-lactamase class C family) [Bacillus horti]